MIKDTDKVVIKNRFNGMVAYSIPDMKVRRSFAPGEVKKRITVEEIRNLDALPGGRELLQDYLLIIEPEELIQELFPNHEPEYKYTEKDIIKLLKEGSINEFKDCMDFAPAGVIELIKSYAVSLPVQDNQKRDYIYEKTGLNVTRAIENKKYAEEGTKQTSEEGKKQTRRVQAKPTIIIEK